MSGASLSSRLVAGLLAEQDRWFLWVPVSLGIGAATYFGLPAEPLLPVLVATTLGAVGLALLYRRWLPGGYIIVLFAAFMAGLTAAKFRAEWVSAPVVTGEIAGASIHGWLDEVRPRRDGGVNLLISVHAIDRLASRQTPKRVRLRLRDSEKISRFARGQAVEIKTWLGAPPGPATPGGYDFSRHAWFDQIGAIGVAHGIEPWADAPARAGVLAAIARAINRARDGIAERILHALPGKAGAIAVALIVGERGYIERSDAEILRNSGLAHVLAISGLHMSLVAGALFVALRGFLAFFPSIAMRHPIKKYAALAALAAATGYLAISGANIATQRAWIMVSIMLIAVLVDRPAITLRNVALAALCIILWRPESVITASFQMSFAAVTALVAAFEFTERRRKARPRPRPDWANRVARAGILYLGGVMVTTLVASAATAPFAAFHFHRFVPFSLAGNLLAMPVIALFVMPLALLSVIAMGFGIEIFPLAMMGTGIDLVLGAAQWVASWPGAEQPIPAFSSTSLLLIVIGGLWLMLWRQRWRLAGLAPMLAGLLFAANPGTPDILIDSRARAIAVREPSGDLQVLVRGRSTFAAEQWLERDGDLRAVEQVSADVFSCDQLACVAAVSGGGNVAIVFHRAALQEECRSARIVVITFERQADCVGPEIVIDELDLETEGAAAIWSDQQVSKIERAMPRSARRPWMRSRHQDNETRRQPLATSPATGA